mmetsp:Transcript_1047/g.2437  ORF Transcript_1047/g.2437 Transcript_1047/m.2437 type:complete len:81 (-) Transcript_1047:56-298(-)
MVQHTQADALGLRVRRKIIGSDLREIHEDVASGRQKPFKWCGRVIAKSSMIRSFPIRGSMEPNHNSSLLMIDPKNTECIL